MQCSTNYAETLTRLAGNAPEYYADEDHLSALLGMLLGLIVSAAFLCTKRLQILQAWLKA